MLAFVDMDEVFCDFVAGALAVHGQAREQVEAKWQPATYDIVPPMGLTNKQFWDPIHKLGSKFWADLPPTSWKTLLHALLNAKFGNNWMVLTRPQASADCYAGKVLWLESHLGLGPDRIILTANKAACAGQGKLLIDDNADDVEAFRRAGGQAIKFPAYTNGLYPLRHNPVEYVRVQLLLLNLNTKERSDGIKSTQRKRSLPLTRYGLC